LLNLCLGLVNSLPNFPPFSRRASARRSNAEEGSYRLLIAGQAHSVYFNQLANNRRNITTMRLALIGRRPKDP
jgi:hypothetical protein